MSLVQCIDVCKSYRLGTQTVTALKEVSLNIEQGVFLAIAGPSGSGKSTLLNMVGCIDTPTSGRVVIDGRETSGRTPDELADVRLRTIGFIFQTFNLLPVLSAAENIEYPLLQFPELSRKDRQRRVEMFLDVVDLAKFADHRPNEMSGGQRQRVAIARALVTNSKIVLADEPTANLDHATGESILELMRNINRSSGTTFVFSTHDRRVMTMADRLVRIEDGAITSLGQRGSAKWLVVNDKRADAEAGRVAMAVIDEEFEKRADELSQELAEQPIDDAPAPSTVQPPVHDHAAIDAINRAAAQRIEAAKAAAKKFAADTVAEIMANEAKENAARLAAERAALANGTLTPLEIAAKIAALDDQLTTATRRKRGVVTELAVQLAVQKVATSRREIEEDAARQIANFQKLA